MTNGQKIVRFFDAELRALGEDGGDMVVEGYALKYGNTARIGNKKIWWNEVIGRSALSGAALDDVVLTFNHSRDNILAGTRNGSLSLTPDDTGLKITARIVDTAFGRDVYRLIQSGLIGKMSYMAAVDRDDWTRDKNTGADIREITSFGRFFDVSAVTFPAYDDTVITARGGEGVEREIYHMQIQKLNKILNRR